MEFVIKYETQKHVSPEDLTIETPPQQRFCAELIIRGIFHDLRNP